MFCRKYDAGIDIVFRDADNDGGSLKPESDDSLWDVDESVDCWWTYAAHVPVSEPLNDATKT